MHGLALLAVALALGQVWGSSPAWLSPGISFGGSVCGPQGCPLAAPYQQPAPSINAGQAREFYDSIDGDSLANAVVRVSVKDRDGSGSLGSGTLVDAFEDGSGLVVTNNHVVAGAASATAGKVIYRTGEQSRIAILAADPVWDLAILDVMAPASVQPVDVAEFAPRYGDGLAIAGYGGEGRLIFQVGTFAKRVAPGPGYPFEQFELQPCQARQGDSGGPVFNRSGKLAGALWGATRGATVATPCTRIRALLDSIRQRLGRRRRGQDQFAGPLVPVQPPASPPVAPVNPPPLPGPIAQQPIAQQTPSAANPPTLPTQPPREAAPPQQPNGSGPSTGGELAGIRDRIQRLEALLQEKLRSDAAAAKPAIVDGAKQIAGEAIKDAAPGIFERLLPYLLAALGGLTGVGLPIGGVAAGSWLVGKAGLLVARWWKGKRARKALAATTATAARKADTQGLAAGMDAGGGKDAPSLISPADLIAFGSKLQADLLAKLGGNSTSTAGSQVQATGGATAQPPAAFPVLEDRATEYGKQLVQASGLTGVDPIVAATRGIVFGDEVDNLIATGDEVAARVANDLRKRVDERVSQIHPLTVKIGA